MAADDDSKITPDFLVKFNAEKAAIETVIEALRFANRRKPKAAHSSRTESGARARPDISIGVWSFGAPTTLTRSPKKHSLGTLVVCCRTSNAKLTTLSSSLQTAFSPDEQAGMSHLFEQHLWRHSPESGGRDAALCLSNAVCYGRHLSAPWGMRGSRHSPESQQARHCYNDDARGWWRRPAK